MRHVLRAWLVALVLEGASGFHTSCPVRCYSTELDATVERHTQKLRKYYDYRRSNDGVFLESGGETVALPPQQEEERTINAEEEEEEEEEAAASNNNNNNNNHHHAWGLPHLPWQKSPEDKEKKKKSRSHCGQSHYHVLHHREIKRGVKSHLREIFGLGSELETYESESEAKKADPTRLTSTPEWAALEAHAREMKGIHLRELLADSRRVAALSLEAAGAYLDYSRQKVSEETMRLLAALARRMDVDSKRQRMREGDDVNTSERRPVLHFALRAAREDVEKNFYTSTVVREAVESAISVRERVFEFADAVRSGVVRTPRGENFASVVVVGIGGSYLGPEFITSAINQNDSDLDLRFVANVDPEAFDRETADLDPTKTLIVVVSKSWSTAETLRNARTVRDWILAAYDDDVDRDTVVASHFCACASRSVADKVKAWGIDPDTRLFEFWNWVGGRYSSSASAGLVPLALARGSSAARAFLEGARDVDKHFFDAPLEKNVPAIMALLGVWNVNFLGLGARAVVPYAHGLSRFAAHVQQLEMESNGKSVTVDGRPLDYTTGEIVFGEPGSNAQHSFFQLLHMGQCVPCDFVGFLTPAEGQRDVAGHHELMANFFAQPDALALGRSFEDVVTDVLVGASDDVDLCTHRTLSGDRPSLTLLFRTLDARAVGALLALYEHRTAIQGWTWDINSYDQWGVELGKTLASDIRQHLANPNGDALNANPSTKRLLDMYLQANAPQSSSSWQ
ncbi:hypothetical protein CTAYLR_000252 [Chrysophaeum taylorii]|uniref:Glucose-6-phosphate isomerase n=1 Tax=Chrysophaeum taylorii TaxID=2483200 RepID=A0AAD7UEF3_9STRA|nr:hypothetical protein CTAYLR_000252 [Chrysophaeum taylorii]